jgi:large subunit ribosomal protein L18
MSTTITKPQQRKNRHSRVRARVHGTAERPRLAVFRSNVHITAQLIDDASRQTLVSAQDLVKANRKGKKPVELAFLVGEEIAKKAKEKNIARAVFDRGGYRYHGRVKALADGARKGGLEF